MLKDLRHGLRMLLRAKAWTAVVVLSLSLGIGANTALFSAVNGLLLKELPVQSPETLVRLRWAGRNDMVTSSSDYGFSAKDAAGLDLRATFSYPMFQQFVADNRTMAELLACAPFGRVNLVVDGNADIASAFVSTGNYYRMLGVTASRGRTILPDDDRPGAEPVAMVSHGYWHMRFGGDPNVVGKTVRVNNVLLTIVGVLPSGFTGIQQVSGTAPDISLPMALEPQLNTGFAGSKRLSEPTNWWLQVMGRLKPGASAAQVQANLETVFRNTARAGLEQYRATLTQSELATTNNRNRKDIPHLRVDSGRRGVYDVNTSDLRSITILSVVVALVLLIVCANVANLLLSRATTRRKEISVRLSMGATRARLIRQLLTESALLAGLGGVLGVLVAYWGRQLLPGAPFLSGSQGAAGALDWRVLSFMLAVTVMTGILFGIAPALRATGVEVTAALKENSRSVVGTRTFLSKALLVMQVALSLVLLVGAGLFLRTLHNLRSVDVGFNPQNLALFRVQPGLNRYDDARTFALYQELEERLRAVPGVRGVALSQPALLSGSVNSTSIFVQGRTYSGGERNPMHRLVVSASFFETMEIPIALGRGFTTQDRDGTAKVVVINEAAVRAYFPNESPLGRRFGQSVETTGQLEVVGVVRDAKYNSVRDPAPPTMYVPYLQNRQGQAVFEVRTAGNPADAMGAIREAVRQVDPNLPMIDVSTQLEQVERRFMQEKVFAQAYSLFGGLAVLLASIGLFGLMSYNVSRRTNEIGIRMALGAQRGDVLRLVMRESMLLVAAGVVIGTAAALAAGRLVASLLYGLGAADRVTLLLAIVAMVIVSALAGYLPARRASRVDPMAALHYE